jgi:NADH dehydrogenase
LRNHIFHCFELASHKPNVVKRKRLQTFAIVGGSPTGVELAGALSELIHRPLSKNYPRSGLGKARVILAEAMAALPPVLPEVLRGFTRSIAPWSRGARAIDGQAAHT